MRLVCAGGALCMRCMLPCRQLHCNLHPLSVCSECMLTLRRMRMQVLIEAIEPTHACLSRHSCEPVSQLSQCHGNVDAQRRCGVLLHKTVASVSIKGSHCSCPPCQLCSDVFRKTSSDSSCRREWSSFRRPGTARPVAKGCGLHGVHQDLCTTAHSSTDDVVA